MDNCNIDVDVIVILCSLTREPREPENSDLNETFHICRGGKQINLEIFSWGPKTILRGETTPHR